MNDGPHSTRWAARASATSSPSVIGSGRPPSAQSGSAGVLAMRPVRRSMTIPCPGVTRYTQRSRSEVTVWFAFREEDPVLARRDRAGVATAPVGLGAGEAVDGRAERSVGRPCADLERVGQIEVSGLAEAARRGPEEPLAIRRAQAHRLGVDLGDLTARHHVGAQRAAVQAVLRGPLAQPVGVGGHGQFERAVASDASAGRVVGCVVGRRADRLATVPRVFLYGELAREARTGPARSSGRRSAATARRASTRYGLARASRWGAARRCVLRGGPGRRPEELAGHSEARGPRVVTHM